MSVIDRLKYWLFPSLKAKKLRVLRSLLESIKHGELLEVKNIARGLPEPPIQWQAVRETTIASLEDQIRTLEI